MIGSGRDKIETPEQFAASLQVYYYSSLVCSCVLMLNFAVNLPCAGYVGVSVVASGRFSGDWR